MCRSQEPGKSKVFRQLQGECGESERWGDALGVLRGHTEGLEGQAEEFVLYTTGYGSLLSGEYKALPLRELLTA